MYIDACNNSLAVHASWADCELSLCGDLIDRPRDWWVPELDTTPGYSYIPPIFHCMLMCRVYDFNTCMKACNRNHPPAYGWVSSRSHHVHGDFDDFSHVHWTSHKNHMKVCLFARILRITFLASVHFLEYYARFWIFTRLPSRVLSCESRYRSHISYSFHKFFSGKILFYKGSVSSFPSPALGLLKLVGTFGSEIIDCDQQVPGQATCGTGTLHEFYHTALCKYQVCIIFMFQLIWKQGGRGGASS